jgi:putative radical SAM enzyme (TIGR03279 family)
MITIEAIDPGSIAEALELRIGSRIVRINGEVVRDGIDFRFLEAEPSLEVEVAEPEGGRLLLEIDKDPAEALGVVPAPDPVRECANKCVFCFIDGNPAGVRRSLYLRDDDFRLSFAYGSYVTLTNLGPRGLERLIHQRLSPLYVSVHATEPWVRERILGVPRGGDIVERLRELTVAGLEVHTQVVLCPGWNDGPHLERTLDELWGLGAGVLSASVVPVGLTAHNAHRPVRPVSPEEADAAIAMVERSRVRALRERGLGWAYAADDMFLIAGRAVPGIAYYDDEPLLENGVGALEATRRDLSAALAAGAFGGRRTAIVTGTRMAGVFRGVLDAAGAADVRILAVPNRLFGEQVSAAGLLPGGDVAAVLEAWEPFDVVLLPSTALNADGVFIDDVTRDAVERAARGACVRFGDSFAEALAA